ncbi:MAG: LysM peptidoglycan-binding domain-containing protein [Gemmatimonadaceae bacterium]
MKDDYLYKIAKNYYGDGTQWRKIYEANKKVIGNDPNLIFPGQVLKIPAA